MTVDARPLLVATDSFKGTLTAAAAARAIGQGIVGGGGAADLAPLADGGDGTLDVLCDALGGTVHRVAVEDPLGRPRSARLGLLAGGDTAVVEVAEASGLALLAPTDRDAEAADSTGTGQLIAAAAAAGARHILVAAGGSATTDGGAGALAAIGDLGQVELVVLCDVQTPFELAAHVFAPQKGADPAAVRRLARRLTRLADRLPRDPRGLPFGGAAGGLAGGLWAAAGARLVAGAPFVLDAIDFDGRMRAARAVIVGEGRLDHTTLAGKAPGEAAVRARQAGVPAHAIVGHNALDRFDARILDLQEILEASTTDQLQAAGAGLVAILSEAAASV